MATIGSKLALPETGWKRCDDNKFNKVGTFNLYTYGSNNSQYYNNTQWSTSINEDYFTVRFIGSKVRIIQPVTTSVGVIDIFIDGKLVSTVNVATFTVSPYIIVFEQLGMEFKEHELKVVKKSGTYMLCDCIDIDDNGFLFHQTLTTNKYILKLNIGECISCNYTYANGFSNFNSNDTLNFVCVENSQTKAILVSDTVIPNLTFDEINQKGFIYGNEISHPFGNNFNATVRSMTSSEYNKYIVNSTLGGLITAGDKNIWNWDVASILSSTPTDDSKITTIGGATVSTTNQALTQIVKATTYGFRPILVIDKLRTSPIFTNSMQFGLHGDNLNLAITDISINQNMTQEDETFDIFIKDSVGNVIYTKKISVSEGSSFSYAIPKDILTITNNSSGKLIIQIVDKENLSYSQKISVAIINNSVYLYDTRYISSNIHNTNLKDNVIIDLDATGNKLLFVCIDSIDYININNLEKANINKKDIKIIAMLDKEATINSFALAFVN